VCIGRKKASQQKKHAALSINSTSYRHAPSSLAFALAPTPPSHSPSLFHAQAAAVVADQAKSFEHELELIQAHMTQKPLLWVEVGAHAVRKR
jgi:hypothetical protein